MILSFSAELKPADRSLDSMKEFIKQASDAVRNYYAIMKQCVINLKDVKKHVLKFSLIENKFRPAHRKL